MMILSKRHKLLVLFCVLSIANGLTAESLAQACTERFGAEDASPYYQQKTKEFLANFGLDANAFVVKKLKPEYAHLNGRAHSSVGIWLNEQNLATKSKGSRLFTIAHEVAHCAQNLSRKRWLAQITPGIPLAGAVYYYATQFTKSTRTILASLAWALSCFTIGKYVEHKVWFGLEKDADIRAAHMLCQNGYTWAVQDELRSIEQKIQAGKNVIDNNHPTLKQQLAYLKNILDKKKTD